MPLFSRTATDTGVTVTDSLRRGVTRVNVVSAAFPSFAPPGQLLDNFNRANENPLSQGGNWTNLGGQLLALVSNAVVANSAGNRCAASYSGAGDFTDCDAWVTLTGSPSTGVYSGVFARQAHTGFVIATGQRSYQVVSDPGANEIILQYVNVGGGVSTLASWPITTSPGDSLGIRCVGTTISAYYKPVGGDWQLLGSVTDTNESHGYIGLVSDDTTFSMDNFGGGVPSPARPFDSIQPNHFTVALADDAFPKAFGLTTLDDFNRPNESPLSGGGRWTRTGTFGSNLNLSSHVTVAATTSQIDSESYVAAPGDRSGNIRDSEVWATFGTIPWPGNSGDTAGVILRQNPATDSQKDCYILAYSGGSTPVLFLTYTDASGASSTLASWSGLGLANGDSIGLRAVGTTFTAYYRYGSGAWQVAGSVTDANGSHGYLGLQQLTVSGIPNSFSKFGGGPVGVWDSILPVRAPNGLFPVQGLTVSDAIVSARSHALADTGLTITDGMVVFINGQALVSLTDNGLVLSESIQKYHATTLADTGLTVSGDSIVRDWRRVRLLVDSLTFSDSLDRGFLTHALADTGLTESDTLRRNHPVALTDIGLTVSDSTKALARRVLADTGLTVTTTLVAHKAGSGFTFVNIIDNGLVLAASLADVEHYFRIVGFGLDQGLTITDGIHVSTTPPHKPVKPHADFTFAVGGLSVVFSDASTPGSTGPITDWFWTFGDGGTSTAENPTHTYAGSGTYTVTLTVTTAGGLLDSVSKPVTVFVPAVGGVHLDFVVV